MVNSANKYESQFEHFLELLSLDGLVRSAARKAGIPYHLVVKKRTEDSDFDSQVEEMTALFTESLEEEAINRALRGEATPIYSKGELIDTVYKKSDFLLHKLLQAKIPDRYGDKREISGAKGGPIEIIINSFDDDEDTSEIEDPSQISNDSEIEDLI